MPGLSSDLSSLALQPPPTPTSLEGNSIYFPLSIRDEKAPNKIKILRRLEDRGSLCGVTEGKCGGCDCCLLKKTQGFLLTAPAAVAGLWQMFSLHLCAAGVITVRCKTSLIEPQSLSDLA